MRFLFKPSLSYALVASMLICSALFSGGHWLAGTVYLVVASIVGGITETVVMRDKA
jgi:hypothetical protein